jgi:putative hemolysin
MSIAGVLLTLAASVGAAACAYADGALLGVDEDAEPLAAPVAALVARRDQSHRALAFARVVLQLLAGLGAGVAVASSRGVALVPLSLALLAGLLLVVLSETTARDAGDRDGEAGLVRMRGLIELLERGLAPVVALGNAVERGLDRAIPARRVDLAAGRDASIARFREVVAAEVDVEGARTPLVSGVFTLGETSVGEVMTPRVDIVGVEQDAGWQEVVARVRRAGHSRIVVHDGDLDGIVGILYAKDLLPFVVDEAEPPGGWPTLVRPAAFIPEGKAVDDQLRDFRASGVHIAVVADEFGGTAGLVTIEDLLELIVGEINDEHDDGEPEVERDGDRVWAAGGVTLDQLSDLVGEDLLHEEVTTLGGLAYELFGRVPRAGESGEWRGWRLVVERVRRRRVERVFLERLGRHDDEGEDA